MNYPQIVIITLLITVFIGYSRQIFFKLPLYKKIWDLDQLKKYWSNYLWLEQPFRLIFLGWLGLFIIERLSPLSAIREIGLLKPVWIGVGFAFIATSPMMIVPLINKVPIRKENFLDLLFGSGIWPLAEEIAFRGFAFGTIYRNATNPQIGLYFGALSTGIIFGLVHLGQDSIKSLSRSGKIFTITIIALGGIIYAWLYASWDGNLWVPLGMHAFMNLWWALFDRSDSAKGGWLSNFTREFAAILAIILTVFKEQLFPFL